MSVVLDALYAFWNQILYAIQNFRIFDLLDIIIIAWLIYKAIGFLRETRAGQLVKGIVILLSVYAFANLFELSVLQWVLSTVVDSAIIAVAIISIKAKGRMTLIFCHDLLIFQFGVTAISSFSDRETSSSIVATINAQ